MLLLLFPVSPICLFSYCLNTRVKTELMLHKLPPSTSFVSVVPHVSRTTGTDDAVCYLHVIKLLVYLFII